MSKQQAPASGIRLLADEAHERAYPLMPGRIVRRYSEDGRLTGEGMAPYFWGERGSLGEEVAPAPEPFVIHVAPDYQADLLRQLCAPGAVEFNAMQDVYRDVLDTGTGATRMSWDVEADQLEIERINMTGARYRESVRLSEHGSQPWDHAAGESS